jgi:4-aminobutyrate aminotransferase-like enzyme
MATTLPPAAEVSKGTTSLEDITRLESQYLLQNYARHPLALHRGKGCYLYDLDGRRYLDLISGIGVNSLGYAHPRITKVIRQQAHLLLHTSNLYYHEYQGQLAEHQRSPAQLLLQLRNGGDGGCAEDDSRARQFDQSKQVRNNLAG